MLVRGVVVSYETIRRWCAKFGQAYANQLRRRRPRLGDKWHLDEVFVKINGITGYLWRAVDQHGNVLDVLVQSRRNAKAAKRFFRKLLKGLQYVPRVLVTDKLASYGVAHRQLMGSVAHRQSRYLNNRAENSHQPTRQRERAMKRFKSVRHAQRGSCDVVVGSLTWEFGRNAVSCLRFGLIQGSRRRRSYGVAHVQGIRDRSG